MYPPSTIVPVGVMDVSFSKPLKLMLSVDSFMLSVKPARMNSEYVPLVAPVESIVPLASIYVSNPFDTVTLNVA